MGAVSIVDKGVASSEETGTKPVRDALWTPQFVLLLVSAVFMYISTFMLTPTLPLFVKQVGAGDLAVGGVIVAAYTLGSLLPRIFWGNLADRWLRQGVYLMGVAIIAVLSPLFAVTVLLPVIIGLRFLQGVGFSGSSTSAAAMSVDLIPASRRAEGVGFYSLANTVGMAIGPNVGLVALQSFGSGWLFTASVIAGGLSFALGLFIRYEHHARRKAAETTELGVDPTSAEPTPEASAPGPKGLSKLIETSVLPVCLIFLFVVTPYGGIMAFVAAYGLEQGVSQIGLYFTVFAIALFVIRLFIGRLGDKHGVTVVFIPGAIASFLGLGVLWFANSLPLFLLSAVLFGLGFGISMPLLQAAAFGFVSPDRRGTASATIFATADIAYGLGAILLGYAMSHLDHRIAFAAMSLFAVVSVPLYLVVLRPKLRAVGRA